MKDKTITLSYPHSLIDRKEDHYRVQKVTNSLEYAPLQYLSKKEADELCESHQWKVTIVPPPRR
jgi:hypothetical protein